MEDSVTDTLDRAVAVVGAYGLSILAAILILIVGFVAARWAQRATSSALSRSGRIDATLRPFLTSLVRYGIIVLTVVIVLERFGVTTAGLVAVLGAAGLAVGLALQGTLSNLAAGVMLLLFRPFRVGQFIEAAGVAGTVEAITLFTTLLNTPDNVHIVVPNGQLWGVAVKNFSRNPTRRLDLVVGIDYGDDIGKAFDTVKALIDADQRVNSDPAPEMMVANLGDNAVEMQFRLWCAASDYWPLRFDLTRRVKEAFDAAGITIPFPQRTLHMKKDG
jgi:small conductance mechanosensitive channel